MSGLPLSTLSQEQILRTLRAQKEMEALGDVTSLTLTPLPGSPHRTDRELRCQFLVTYDTRAIAHLTVGSDLASLHERSQAFNAASPGITLKTLFFIREDGVDYLGREYFPGTTIEDCLNAGAIKPETAAGLKEQALRALELTATSSSARAAQAEARDIFAAFAELPLNPVDRGLILDVLAPLILEEIAARPATRRWSNGDFTPRNLIVDTRGNLRLIDYEFAHFTHFPEEDAWRWQTFSSAAKTDPVSLPAWLEIFFWIKQMVLSHRTVDPAHSAKDAEHALRQIGEKMAAIPRLNLAGSHLLNPLSQSSKLDEENRRLSSINAALADKLSRIQNSRSWKITAWLRALRRLVSRSS